MGYGIYEYAVIIAGTILLLSMAGFVTALMFLYKRKYQAHQTEVALLYETHRREILTAQLETQNQTLQRVADDLHDHVGQMLSVVWLHLNRLHTETENMPAQATVDDLLTYTSSLVADVRSISKALSTDTIARFGLMACLDLEVDRINRAGSMQRITSQVSGEPYSMGVQTEIVLLRMIQESLNNAIKHAPGAPITLTLDYKPDILAVSIVDEGPGFSMNDLETRALTGSGQGLYNLRRRASMLGGTCSWGAAYEASQTKPGTRVLITIPSTNAIHQDIPVKGGTEHRVATA